MTWNEFFKNPIQCFYLKMFLLIRKLHLDCVKQKKMGNHISGTKTLKKIRLEEEEKEREAKKRRLIELTNKKIKKKSSNSVW